MSKRPCPPNYKSAANSTETISFQQESHPKKENQIQSQNKFQSICSFDYLHAALPASEVRQAEISIDLMSLEPIICVHLVASPWVSVLISEA